MVYIIIYTIICHINYIKGVKNVYRSNNMFTNHTNDTNRIINLLNEQMIINRSKQIATYEQPPEFIKLQGLLIEFTKNHTWDNVITIGDIYKNGAYPRFKYNKEMAIECYKVAAMCPNSDVAGIAQIKYIETIEDIKKNHNKVDIDNEGEDIPTMFGKEICELGKEIIRDTPYNSFSKPKSKHNPVGLEPMYFDITNNTAPLFAFFTETIQERPTIQHTYRNDLQNVHDHSVTGIIKKNIQLIKQENLLKNVNKDDNAQNVINAILNSDDLSTDIKGNAITVITTLNDIDSHGTYNVTEKDALSIVWNKINNESDEIKKKNMIDILAKQLDSGVENGHVVCSSGKIARIISTFDGVDDSMTTSRPIWAIREELATLAGKINNTSNNPKMDFINTANDLYINQLHLDPNVINPIIEEYSEHLS